MNSFWIHHLFREFVINSISFSRIHSWFIMYFADWLFNTRIHLNTLFCSISRIHFTLKKFFAETAWINYLYREFTLILFPRSLWMQYFFEEIHINSLSAFTMNALFVSQIQLESSIFFALTKFTIFFANSLSVSRIHSWFIMHFVTWLFDTRIHFEYIILNTFFR